MKQAIRLFPDPVLRANTKKVKKFDADLKLLIAAMDATMRSQPHGIGIAAPQIGVSLAVALVDVSARVPGATRLVLVNPSILGEGPEISSREGCMSLPDYTADLTRREWVRLRWQDADGVFCEHVFFGIEGICVQHEVDHLSGKLFLDRVTCLKTDMFPRKKSKKRRPLKN